MKTVYPGPHATWLLCAAARYYRKGATASCHAALEAFLAGTDTMRDLRVDAILPKLGTTIRLMARLQSKSGEMYFLKISQKTDEYRFFRNAGKVKDDLERHNICIVWPDLALATPTMAGLLFPYHDFMLAQDNELDLASASATIARLNGSGRQLRRVITTSKEQRRTVFVPNLMRRTIMNNRFLKNDRDVFVRTAHAMLKYRQLQTGTEKVFSHGDVKPENFFQQNGTNYIIDFGNYFFAEPGMDLARLLKGSEDEFDRQLELACSAYADAFDGQLSQRKLRLGALYGYFLLKLRQAIYFKQSAAFRTTLKRLETEMDSGF